MTPEPAASAAPTAVLLLGTAHVVPLRAAIQHHLFDFRPGAVALELDRDRLAGLLTPPEARQKHPGFGYRLLSRFQERVANDLGGVVGDEMLAAREAAMLLKVPVALVDRPVQETLRRLARSMGWTERLRLVGSLVASALPGRGLEKDLQRALDGDPALLEEVARKFPGVARVLIDERNEIMARSIVQLTRRHGRVAAVVGDAHVPGITALLAGVVDDLRCVRVRELSQGVPAQAGFTVEVRDG